MGLPAEGCAGGGYPTVTGAADPGPAPGPRPGTASGNPPQGTATAVGVAAAAATDSGKAPGRQRATVVRPGVLETLGACSAACSPVAGHPPFEVVEASSSLAPRASVACRPAFVEHLDGLGIAVVLWSAEEIAAAACPCLNETLPRIHHHPA